MNTNSNDPTKHSKRGKRIDGKRRASWPMDCSWISSYARKDRSKGRIPVRGYWRKRTSQKPKDQTVKVLEFFLAINETEQKILALVAGLEDATRELNGSEGNSLVIGAAAQPPDGTTSKELGGSTASPSCVSINEEPSTQH